MSKQKLKIYFQSFHNFSCSAGMKVNSIWSIDLWVPLGAGTSPYPHTPIPSNQIIVVKWYETMKKANINQCGDFVGSVINHMKRSRLYRFWLSWIRKFGWIQFSRFSKTNAFQWISNIAFKIKPLKVNKCICIVNPRADSLTKLL